MALILVVDHDDEYRSAVRELLETHGFEVSEARDGRLALEYMLSMDTPALVILDLEIPVMSGTELLNLMRRYYRLARIPVLVFSLRGQTEMIAHPMVVGVIAKPFDASALIATVKSHVRIPPGSSNPV